MFLSHTDVSLSPFLSVFIHCFLYQWSVLFQVSLPVFGEQSCKTALLRESSGVVLFGKSWFLPTIRGSKEFCFISTLLFLVEITLNQLVFIYHSLLNIHFQKANSATPSLRGGAFSKSPFLLSGYFGQCCYEQVLCLFLSFTEKLI